MCANIIDITPWLFPCILSFPIYRPHVISPPTSPAYFPDLNHPAKSFWTPDHHTWLLFKSLPLHWNLKSQTGSSMPIPIWRSFHDDMVCQGWTTHPHSHAPNSGGKPAYYNRKGRINLDCEDQKALLWVRILLAISCTFPCISFQSIFCALFPNLHPPTP